MVNDVIAKLSGLNKGEKRLFFVEIKAEDSFSNATKIFFKTSNEAIQAFKYLSEASPITTIESKIYEWDSEYKKIEDELKKEKDSLCFDFLSNSVIILGSQIVKAYNSREESNKHKEEKLKELKERVEYAKSKKEEGGVPF